MNIRKIFWMTVLALLSLSACTDDDLGTVEKASVLRFEFPQGNDAWDREFNQIAEDWGMYVIYRDIDSMVLNRSWTNPSSGAVSYMGDPVPDEYMPVYLDIVKNSLLGPLDKHNESHRKQLPIYFFLLNNFRDSQGKTMQINTNGFDYWVLSFTDAELASGLNAVTKHKIACTFGYLPISSAMAEGTLVIPDEFIRTTDYTSPIATEINGRFFYDAHDSINFFLRRGFLPETTVEFVENPGPAYNGTPGWMPWIPGMPGNETFTRNPNYERDVEVRYVNDFMNYIRSAMMYTEEQLKAKYPLDATDPLDQKGNAIIQNKYAIMIKYMASQGYNLQDFAKILIADETDH